MGSNSKIEWCDASCTPIRARRKDTGKVGVHCVKVSPECAHCYSDTFNQRNLPNHGTGLAFNVLNQEKVDIFLDEKMLLAPLSWRRPRRIFWNSQTDAFADFVPDEMLDRMFAVQALTPWHTHLNLTKRAERMFEYVFRLCESYDTVSGRFNRTIQDHCTKEFREQYKAVRVPSQQHFHGTTGEYLGEDRAHWEYDFPDVLPNVWFGVTAGTRKSWADRVKWLRKTPAIRRFISAEPLLEDLGAVDLSGIDWLIAGGESGRDARPMHPGWVRNLRDQCRAAAVPFFFKQVGQYSWDDVDPGTEDESDATEYINLDGSRGSGWVLGGDPEVIPNYCGAEPGSNCVWVRRMKSKHAAGRLLDGVEWSQFPAMEGK